MKNTGVIVVANLHTINVVFFVGYKKAFGLWEGEGRSGATL